MTEQSAIPGLHETGMFFEYYIFKPRNNFKEEDLHHVLQYFDITFHDLAKIPDSAKQHFDGATFKPQQGLTVHQFADILKAMEIKLSEPKILMQLPEPLREHFNDDLVFDPFDDFALKDLNLFLEGFARLRLNTKQFNTLPRLIKRQFIIYTRDGKSWRYGDRRPG